MDKHFPKLYAVDPEDCGCTECITGDYVPLGVFIANAKIGDVMALVSGDISNNTYYPLSELIEKISAGSEDDEVAVISGRLAAIGALSGRSEIPTMEGPQMFERAVAIDPEGCGCTECLTGEYVPQERFVEYAEAADVLRLIRGEFANHTFLTDEELVDHVLWRSPNSDIEELRERLAEF